MNTTKMKIMLMQGDAREMHTFYMIIFWSLYRTFLNLNRKKTCESMFEYTDDDFFDSNFFKSQQKKKHVNQCLNNQTMVQLFKSQQKK